jgi:hypothetical protein
MDLLLRPLRIHAGPFEAFAKSVDKLDSAAAKTQKDAATMRERADAYFQQWETQNSGVQK